MYKERKEDSDDGIQYRGYMGKEMGFSMFRERRTGRKPYHWIHVDHLCVSLSVSVGSVLYIYTPVVYHIDLYLMVSLSQGQQQDLRN